MINYQVENNTGIITLNRPDKRNALHPELVEEMKNKLEEIKKDSRVKVLIITGAGKSFCSGADLSYLNELKNYSVIENENDSSALAQLFLNIYNFPKPTIAAVNGAAIAGGCGLAGVCDFVIADKTSAKFGYSEVKIGFLPAIVSIFLIKKIGAGKAKNLLISGDIINAEQARTIGLADFIAVDVMAEAKTLSEKLSNNSGFSMSFTKEMIHNIAVLNVDEAVDYCIRLNTISRSSTDFQKGLNSFLNKK